MFHASFDTGRFPKLDGPDQKQAKRDYIAKHVGPRPLALIEEARRLDFDNGGPERLMKDGVPANHRDGLFMALTHEVDDLMDGGLVLAPKYGSSIEERSRCCAALARQLDEEQLAQTIEAHAERYASYAWMQGLEVEKLSGYSVVPHWRSYLRLRRSARRGANIKVY
ncbi:MAG: hypothetical protein AAGI12_06480 [Pseudomonadota bacterium]